MITNAEIIDVCGRVSELLAAQDNPCRSWVIFFETSDLNGASSYTYRVADEGDTAEEAIRSAVDRSLPSFLIPAEVRITRVWAARTTDVTEFDGYRISATPQFRVRY
jgi:hypothetical protein